MHPPVHSNPKRFQKRKKKNVFDGGWGEGGQYAVVPYFSDILLMLRVKHLKRIT